MGNCIIRQKEIIRVVKPDGEILEYKAPRKVRHVLSEFVGHAISDIQPVFRHLHPDANMLPGHKYYLVPLPMVIRPATTTTTGKKVITFPKPDVAAGQGTGEGGVVRIKLIISKKELQEMLQKGRVTVGDMMTDEFQKNEMENKVDSLSVDDNINARGWKPKLETIPEGN